MPKNEETVPNVAFYTLSWAVKRARHLRKCGEIEPANRERIRRFENVWCLSSNLGRIRRIRRL